MFENNIKIGHENWKYETVDWIQLVHNSHLL
jgi:hypothetical protein